MNITDVNKALTELIRLEKEVENRYCHSRVIVGDTKHHIKKQWCKYHKTASHDSAECNTLNIKTQRTSNLREEVKGEIGNKKVKSN